MMKPYMIFRYFLMLPVLFALSCGGGSEDSQPPGETKNPPAKTVGTLPANGEPCSDYEPIEGNETKVSVLFTWNAAQLADRYILQIQDENTEVFNESFTSLSASVNLNRGVTYTWSVTTVNDNGQTSGDTYSFTTPGTPEGNYAPYPAAISVDFDEMNTSMSVSWIGSDEDGDDLTFDVFVYEEGSLIAEQENLTVLSLDPISYLPGYEYSIEVNTKDDFGNSTKAIHAELAPE
jgi:hypothetical protein